ncbi:LacI family transcriptional regulator [Pseudoflavitalea sp. G-6-1-2]|uniref:LacI family DNA-binding transcriptional regulator n=1 Tax=Pseudoflavitalea sp. G-6-1-2 TaxID=2728841 RepID=UPI00146D91C5|nr:LacI family DNA-binding transcriptional regulator [Pseudoflavitalea sp. G-6-1-2]NML22197.1 LacI family transcriptional regulator [Pseudoflavitalea sp. G-6-1-2]
MPNVDLKRLAKELNLAVSTVSRALRDSYEISAETKQRVFELARKLNYVPNPYASSLRKQKSKTIAVVVPEIANNFFALAINGIESIAQEKGYHVLIYLTHEQFSREESIARHLQSGRVDGALVSLSGETSSFDHLNDLKQTGVPIVFFDRVCETLNSGRVTTNDFESGMVAAEHLVERGCRKIAYLSISNNLSIASKRMDGYLKALEKAGVPHDPKLVLQCSANDNEANYKAIVNLLKKKNRPDGIFASVEKLAILSYQACEELKLKIPEDIKILGFSNLETAAWLNPSLTTITQPAFEIGKEAAALLFKTLEKKSMNFSDEKIMLNSKLIVRKSTGN